MSLRVIAFVDHEIGFRLLQKMISLSTDTKFQLVAVVTTIENGQMWWPGIDDLCQEASIPVLRYQEPFIETLAFVDIDWYFLISWKHIIPESLLNHPGKGVINLHYSLLPEYRGVYPVNWTVIDGKKITGVTYHLVNKKIDDGEIILQGEAPILMSDTARSLQIRLDDLAYELFDRLLCRLAKADLGKSSYLDRGGRIGSYKSRRDFNALCAIDLDRHYRGSEFLNLLRGMTFFSSSKNAFFIDPQSGRRIYISLNMEIEE